MRAAILTEDGFTFQDVNKPAITADEVLVKTKACGVCSGDVFVYQNKESLASTHSRLGHEASGEIVEVGANVSGFTVGDRVTALALPAYQDYFTATPGQLVKLPEAVDIDMVIGEALACCVHAAGRFGTRPGDKVAVIGGGFMGLVCQQLAVYQQAGLICLIEPQSDRRAMAESMGAHVTYDPREKSASDIMAKHGEFDVVIEAAGSQSAVDLATELVTQHGKIILVGYHQSNDGMRQVNMERWNFKAIDVINGHVRREDEKLDAMRQGVELLAQGHLQTEPLLSFYDFADMDQAFQALTSGSDGLFKAVVRMPD